MAAAPEQTSASLSCLSFPVTSNVSLKCCADLSEPSRCHCALSDFSTPVWQRYDSVRLEGGLVSLCQSMLGLVYIYVPVTFASVSRSCCLFCSWKKNHEAPLFLPLLLSVEELQGSPSIFIRNSLTKLDLSHSNYYYYLTPVGSDLFWFFFSSTAFSGRLSPS